MTAIGAEPKESRTFGFSLPFLPDFLTDHTLLGAEPNERLPEHHRRWAQFIASMWREQTDATYALRFDWVPSSSGLDQGGRLAILFLVRIREAKQGAETFLHDLETTLRTFGLQPERLSREALAQYQSDLTAITEGESGSCFEVRQQIFNVSYKKENSTFDFPPAFVCQPANLAAGELPTLFAIHPWLGAGGSYLIALGALTAQPCASSLCVILQPTKLKKKEQTLFADAAREGETIAQQATTSSTGMGGVQVRASQNRTDPQLRWASRLYAINLRRLTQPFLCATYCFSAREGSARQIAYSLASDIREDAPSEKPIGESEVISSGVQVVSLSTSLAAKICNDLAFDYASEVEMRVPGLPSMDLERMPFLMDARGATTAFRLPINVRGGVLGVEVKQRPPDFHPGPRQEIKPADHIELGRFHAGGIASLPIRAFQKHALVTGSTGSGKTTSILNLLHQFWIDHKIPFMVIESAKKEYRGLLANPEFATSLSVYTLGNETCAPIRLNPFELLPRMRVEAHTNRLQACFEAALPPLPFLPSILAEALERVYKKFWWVSTDVYDPETQYGRRFPRMADFYEMVGQVAEDRNYAGEMKSNIVAATTGRIKQLLIGSIGMMFDAERSVPASFLFERPAILELNDLNLQDKSLVMMFLLTLLREYRELNPSGDLKHITVVEEAHNVLGRPESQGTGEGAGADTKAKSVEAFCNMLAEVRALGEGLIIADQSPNKLAPDALRNTNVQIAHQLRDAHDRESIANALIMDDEQSDFLGKLEPGRAALFYTGLQKATFIEAVNYNQRYPRMFSEHLADGKVKEHMEAVTGQYRRPMLPFAGCTYCTSQCKYRQGVTRLIHEKVCDAELQKQFTILTQAPDENDVNGSVGGVDGVAEAFVTIAAICDVSTRQLGDTGPDAAWCSLLHNWDLRVKEGANTVLDTQRDRLVEAVDLLRSTVLP